MPEARNSDRCPAHTHQPWASTHHHGLWPPGVRRYVMWIFAILVLGVLATGIVFAVNESLRLAGLRGFAGASSGRMIAEADGCAGLGRPDICCPDGMACFDTDFSLSKIYCRSVFLPSFTCPPSFDVPAVCIPGLKNCNATMGGACCPLDAMCSLEGCIGESAENSTVMAIKIGEVCGTPTAVSSGAKRIFGCPGWVWLAGSLVLWPVLSILTS